MSFSSSSPFSVPSLRWVATLLVALLGLCSSALLAEDAPKITEVRIVDLSGMTEEEVLARLGGRLDFITSRPPSRSRADDADFLVSRLLEKEGYSDVTISWSCLLYTF
jgi:hypothetical protein